MSSRRRRQGMKQTSASQAMDAKVYESTDVDWRDFKTARQCLSHLCISDYLADITFTFSSHNNVKLPAHKFVLSMRSSVFEAMFHGPLAEVGNSVLIEDINPDTMKVILRFMYSDKPILDGNNVLACLYAAKKYALTGLVKQCSLFLESNIDSSNVCAVHEQAVFYDMKHLETRCFEYILDNAADVFASRGFLKVSHATLLNLLKHDQLAEDEVNVFNAAIQWSRYNCKSKKETADSQHMRKSLGEALFAIRFPTMPISDFAKVVTPVGILTSKEQVMMYQYNATGGYTPLDKFPVRQRSRKELTIDVSGATQNMSQISGYRLGIAYQPGEEQPLNARNPRIKSITGTFAKHVNSISLSSISNIADFVSEGNKITFLNPLEIPEGTLDVYFKTGNMANFYPYQTASAVSHNTETYRQVYDRNIFISYIPAGMQSISFVKLNQKGHLTIRKRKMTQSVRSVAY